MVSLVCKTERIDDKAAAASAAKIESTAYAAAETAGSGALREYANKAAELVLAELQHKSVAGAPPAEAPTNVVSLCQPRFLSLARYKRTVGEDLTYSAMI